MTDEQMDFPIDEELRGLADDYLAEAQLPGPHIDQAFAQVSSKMGAASASAGISGVAKTGIALGVVTSVFVAAMVLLRPPSVGPEAVAQVESATPAASQAAPRVATAPVAPVIEPVVEPALPPEAKEAPVVIDDDTAPVEEARAKKPARRSSPKKPAKVPAGTTPKASTAKDELLLLERARKAMRSGQPSSCLELLDQHEAKFPESRFGRERDATRVAALCKAGRETKARKVASSYVKRYGRERASFQPDDPCGK